MYEKIKKIIPDIREKISGVELTPKKSKINSGKNKHQIPRKIK
jgi:hypothetical protein